jgi:glycosyltransferase involved in cell wall biosynthesis
MRIWIVTPSLNQCLYLRQTIDSVLSQAGEFDLRHLVVDGGSTDGSVEVLRSITDPRLAWTSQPDAGQSDAVNKGLAVVDMAGPPVDGADGCDHRDVIGWLNSDDLYRPGALAAVAAAFTDPAVQWAVGRYRVVDDAGQPTRRSIVRYKERRLRRYAYRRLLRENFIAQPSVFWRASFGRRVGPLDPSLHYTMDYDLWLRMARLAPPLLIDRELADFRVHGGSKTGRINRAQFDEGYAVARRHFAGDRASLLVHRFNVEKIVWAYRLLQRLGR